MSASYQPQQRKQRLPTNQRLRRVCYVVVVNMGQRMIKIQVEANRTYPLLSSGRIMFTPTTAIFTYTKISVLVCTPLSLFSFIYIHLPLISYISHSQYGHLSLQIFPYNFDDELQTPTAVASVEGEEQGDHMLMGTNGGGGGIGSVFFNRLKKTFASTTKKPVRGGASYGGGVHFDDEPPLISMVANTALGRWLSPEGKHGRGSGSSSGNGTDIAATDNSNDCRDRADSSVCGTPSVRLDSTTQQQQQQPSPRDGDHFLEESNTQNNMVHIQASVLFLFIKQNFIPIAYYSSPSMPFHRLPLVFSCFRYSLVVVPPTPIPPAPI